MSDDGGATIVIDNGSCTSRAGFAGDKAPKTIFPCVVGKSRNQGVMGRNFSYVGNQAQARRGLLNLTYPIGSGIITNWEEMEMIWRHIFENELRVAPEDHAVLLTEMANNPKICREKTAKVMFETFNVPALYLAPEAVLSLHASGRKTGLVLESGHGKTYAVAISEGHIVQDPFKIDVSNMAGRNLSEYFLMLLRISHRYVDDTSMSDIVGDMKEVNCYVALDFEKEMASASSSTTVPMEYELPDGQVIRLDKERFRCTESIFQPSLMGRNLAGVHNLTQDAITKCDASLVKELYANIVLSGGNTMFPGFAERLQKEILALAAPTTKVNVIAPTDGTLATWVGGSMLASQPSFQKDMKITKQEYDEVGPSIVNRK